MQMLLQRLLILTNHLVIAPVQLYTNADGLLNKKHELLNFVVEKSPKIIAISAIVPKIS